MAYVYRHRKLSDDSVFYIGISKKDKCRKTTKHHRSDLWSNIVNKYGFYPEVIATGISYDEAKELEIFMISLYGRIDNKTGILANLTDGGEGASNVSKQRLKKHNPRFNGKKHSKEVVEGIKKRMKGYTPHNAIKSRSKQVYCGFTGKTYKSISDCARDLKVSQSFISNMINGKYKNKFNVEVK